MFSGQRIGYSRDVDADVHEPPGQSAQEGSERKGMRALFRRSWVEDDGTESGVQDADAGGMQPGGTDPGDTDAGGQATGITTEPATGPGPVTAADPAARPAPVPTAAQAAATAAPASAAPSSGTQTAPGGSQPTTAARVTTASPASAGARSTYAARS